MSFTRLSFLTLVFTITSLNFLFAQSFEGTIKCEYKHAISGETIHLTYHVKAAQMALEMTFNSQRGPSRSKYIPDLKTGEMTMLTYGQNPEDNTYRIVQSNDITKPSSVGALLNTHKGDGEKEVFDHNCEKIIISAPATKTVSWIATDLNIDLYKYAPYFKSDQSVAGLSQLQMTGFPMQSTIYDNKGLELISINVVSIEEKELDQAMFEVPAKFKEARVEFIGNGGEGK